MPNLYRLIKVVFVILGIALLWAATHPGWGGLVPTDSPTPSVPGTWSHIQTTWAPLPTTEWVGDI